MGAAILGRQVACLPTYRCARRMRCCAANRKRRSEEHGRARATRPCSTSAEAPGVLDALLPALMDCDPWKEKKATTKHTKSTKGEFEELLNRVVGCAIEVHRRLRPRPLESANELRCEGTTSDSYFDFLRALRGRMPGNPSAGPNSPRSRGAIADKPLPGGLRPRRTSDWIQNRRAVQRKGGFPQFRSIATLSRIDEHFRERCCCAASALSRRSSPSIPTNDGHGPSGR